MKKSILVGFACAIAIQLIGCNVGMTASGGSPEETKAAFDKQPLDVRAKSLMMSPAPFEQKKKMIEDMYAKEGKKVPDGLFGGGPTAH